MFRSINNTIIQNASEILNLGNCTNGFSINNTIAYSGVDGQEFPMGEAGMQEFNVLYTDPLFCNSDNNQLLSMIILQHWVEERMGAI